jgi:hypothetical protein
MSSRSAMAGADSKVKAFRGEEAEPTPKTTHDAYEVRWEPARSWRISTRQSPRRAVQLPENTSQMLAFWGPRVMYLRTSHLLRTTHQPASDKSRYKEGTSPPRAIVQPASQRPAVNHCGRVDERPTMATVSIGVKFACFCRQRLAWCELCQTNDPISSQQTHPPPSPDFRGEAGEPAGADGLSFGPVRRVSLATAA